MQIKMVGSIATLVAVIGAGLMVNPTHVQAEDGSEQALVKRGFEIAPVPLNMAGKNYELVGLGSYLVNGPGDCNGCHTSGGPPNFDYAVGANPYFKQPKKVDPAVYLGGGQDFGPVGSPDNPGPDIIARNLTPDKTGMAAGGHTLSEFLTILKTGQDFDNLHPTCSATVTTNCVPAPVDGSLLQIMPWPSFQNMTDRHLHAIYEYLSAIPCIAGPPAPSNLHNDCN
jgi:hypothetical protein